MLTLTFISLRNIQKYIHMKKKQQRKQQQENEMKNIINEV